MAELELGWTMVVHSLDKAGVQQDHQQWRRHGDLPPGQFAGEQWLGTTGASSNNRESNPVCSLPPVQGHIPSNNVNVIPATKPDPNNLVNRLAMCKTTRFQRGHSVQYLRVHAGNRYKMTPQEIQRTRVMELANPCRKFDKYCWNNGWMWIYGHAIHISMAQCGENSPHRAVLTQAFEHLGQAGMLRVSPEQQAAITQVRVAASMDSAYIH